MNEVPVILVFSIIGWACFLGGVGYIMWEIYKYRKNK